MSLLGKVNGLIIVGLMVGLTMGISVTAVGPSALVSGAPEVSVARFVVSAVGVSVELGVPAAGVSAAGVSAAGVSAAWVSAAGVSAGEASGGAVSS